MSRVGHVLTWAKRYQRLAPLSLIEVEHVRFVPQLLKNPAIASLDYRRGTLAGWEVLAFLLEKKTAGSQLRCGPAARSE